MVLVSSCYQPVVYSCRDADMPRGVLQLYFSHSSYGRLRHCRASRRIASPKSPT